MIHLRDASHPQQQLQKDSVIKILKELDFDPSFYSKRMIEVWNKVDLVEGRGKELEGSGVRISC